MPICAVPNGGGFESVVLDQASGFAAILLEGRDASEFLHEGGGHRWQRIPPTERRGRVHTSTVTVAVLPLDEATEQSLPVGEVEITTTRGSGPGGQHRNTTDSCVIARHKPTGLTVRIDGRSQHANRRLAMELLAGKVAEAAGKRQEAARNADRRKQVGSGERGDKIRTYRVRDDQITDHRSGRKMKLSAWLRGE